MKRFSTSGIRGKVAPLSSFGAEVLWSTNPSTAKDIRQLVCRAFQVSWTVMCYLIGIFCAAQRLGPACTSVGK